MLAFQIAVGIIGGGLGLFAIAEGVSFVLNKRRNHFTPNWPF
jgi:hypothetical protein